MSLNKKMGDAHEAFLCDLFEGKQARGSGNQWRNPMDGRTSRKHLRFAFAWDGKSTLSKSVGVTLAMWGKAREQAGGERPMLALRFYKDQALNVLRDLVVVSAHDFAEVLEAANKMGLIEDTGCLEGIHDFASQESGSVPGMMVKNGPCVACGRSPYEAAAPADGGYA